jgi:xanthine dehydrogenase accessory factor
MFPDIYAKAAELAAKGKSFAVATVVRVEGSSSAQRGSKAIVDEQGKLVLGWVGGGCAESTVRHEALRSIRIGQPSLITLDMTEEILGVGMPCGGKMDVYIEPVLPKPELLIAGHGRISEALASLGQLLGFRVTVNDPGAESAAFPQADRLVAKDFDLSQTTIGANTYVVIATQHKNDHLWLQKALNSQSAYVALVASQHRATLVLDYLAAEGISPDRIANIFTPAGLDLGATTPEEIALSIMSQIVALRRGGKVGRIRLHESQLSDTIPPREKSNQPEDHDRVISQCDAPSTR